MANISSNSFYILLDFDLNLMKRPERPSEQVSFMVSENWQDLSRENPRYGVLSSRRVTKSYFEIHQKVLLICSKILKNCNLNKKLYRSTYFLPQKLKFMIIFCRQHFTHYYCQHILYQDLNLTFYAKFGRLDIQRIQWTELYILNLLLLELTTALLV